MDLRITPQTTLANVLAQMNEHTNRLGKLQQQAATGKKVLTPSDDPIHLSSLLAAKSGDYRLESYLAGIQESQSSLNIGVTALQDASAVMIQARAIALEGSHSTLDAPAREVLAQQVDQLLNRMLELANTQHAGQFLFAGADSRTKPFAVAATDSLGRPLGVDYLGASQRNGVPISPSQAVATLYGGNEVFQRRDRGPTVITGATGAAPGAGTDSAIGQGTLLVRHASTSFSAGSGVQPGADSATGDAILGPSGAHHLTIVDTSGTGAFGTIALNDGPAFPFTNADANLKITGPRGEAIYVNTTAMTAGFSGAVDIASGGTLSVDGGATSVPIDFSANQIVADSVTGAVTNIDSTNIRSTGTDHLDYQGTYDAFQSLMALRDDLRNTRGLSETDLLQSISRRVAELDHAQQGILHTVGEQSASLQYLESFAEHVREAQVVGKQLISDLEDVDISQVVVQMQANQNLLDLTLAVAARLQDQSLLDFMR